MRHLGPLKNLNRAPWNYLALSKPKLKRLRQGFFRGLTYGFTCICPIINPIMINNKGSLN